MLCFDDRLANNRPFVLSPPSILLDILMKTGLVMCVLLINAVIVQSAHQSVRTMRQIGSAMKLKINAVFVRKGTYTCTVVYVYIFSFYLTVTPKMAAVV